MKRSAVLGLALVASVALAQVGDARLTRFVRVAISQALNLTGATVTGGTFTGATISGSSIHVGSLSSVYWEARGGTTSIPSGGTGPTTIVYGDKTDDSHSGYSTSTGLYTVPANQGGVFAVTGGLLLASGSYSGLEIQLYVNNTAINATIAQDGIGTAFNSVNVSGLVHAAPGDTISMRGYQTNAANASRSQWPDARFNYFAGWKIK